MKASIYLHLLFLMFVTEIIYVFLSTYITKIFSIGYINERLHIFMQFLSYFFLMAYKELLVSLIMAFNYHTDIFVKILHLPIGFIVELLAKCVQFISILDQN